MPVLRSVGWAVTRHGGLALGATAERSDPNGADRLAEWLAATARGDRAAFKALYQATASPLLSVALRILRRREAAEEALQEAFAFIWQKAGTYAADRGQPYPWMAMIVRCRAIDRARATARHDRAEDIEGLELDAENLGSPWSPRPFARPDDGSRDVRVCLSKLPDRYRSALALAFYDGLTHEELAERLNAPLGTVKSWVRRGLSALKECLES